LASTKKNGGIKTNITVIKQNKNISHDSTFLGKHGLIIAYHNKNKEDKKSAENHLDTAFHENKDGTNTTFPSFISILYKFKYHLGYVRLDSSTVMHSAYIALKTELKLAAQAKKRNKQF